MLQNHVRASLTTRTQLNVSCAAAVARNTSSDECHIMLRV